MNEAQLQAHLQAFQAQFAPVLRHLRGRVEYYDQLFGQGLIPTLNAFKEALEKNNEATRLNLEAQARFAQYAQNAGAVYAEQIPGRRTPFYLNADVTIPAGVTTRQSQPQIVQGGGPYEIAQLMCAVRMSVPVGLDLTVGPPATVIYQTRLRSHNSAMSDPLASPDPTAAAQPSYTPNVTYNGGLDFLVSYQAGKSAKFRMNVPIPSSFLFSNDRPAYLACGDLLDSVDSIVWSVDPLFATFAWIGGVTGDTQNIAAVAAPAIVSLTTQGVVYAQPPDQKV